VNWRHGAVVQPKGNMVNALSAYNSAHYKAHRARQPDTLPQAGANAAAWRSLAVAWNALSTSDKAQYVQARATTNAERAQARVAKLAADAEWNARRAALERLRKLMLNPHTPALSQVRSPLRWYIWRMDVGPGENLPAFHARALALARQHTPPTSFWNVAVEATVELREASSMLRTEASIRRADIRDKSLVHADLAAECEARQREILGDGYEKAAQDERNYVAGRAARTTSALEHPRRIGAGFGNPRDIPAGLKTKKTAFVSPAVRTRPQNKRSRAGEPGGTAAAAIVAAGFGPRRSGRQISSQRGTARPRRRCTPSTGRRGTARSHPRNTIRSRPLSAH
jgi:hypothetical protein